MTGWSYVNVVILLILCSFYYGCHPSETIHMHKGKVKKNIHRPVMEAEFYGTIDENTNDIILQPDLVAIDKDAPRKSGRICEFQLLSYDGNRTLDLPFDAFVLDPTTGAGGIQLSDRRSLTCDEKARGSVRFHVVARDCGAKSKKSRRSLVTVEVRDRNEHAPVFARDEYRLRLGELTGEVAPGRALLGVRAVDADCDDGEWSRICRYELDDDDDRRFNITPDGVVVAAERIEATSESQVFNLSVTAVDCGGLVSPPVAVHIEMAAKCQPGWSGVWGANRIEFQPHGGAVTLFPDRPRLQTCMGRGDVAGVDVTVTLDVDSRTRGGCDRDLYALRDARKLCKAKSSKLIELLPTMEEYVRMIKRDENLLKAEERVLRLPERDVDNAAGRAYAFDGAQQAFDVADDDNELADLNLTSRFAVSFRIFLDPSPEDQKKSGNRSNEKQTVVCKSDSAGRSRHHLSVYVQRCHVMLLLRDEDTAAARQEEGGATAERPAEWHWKLDEQNECYGKWYTVLVNVDYPNAELRVDGNARKPYLVADDYRLHPTHFASRWSVGAAWEGRSGKYVQFLRGLLSDVVVHPGQLEHPSVLRCLDRCKEGLQRVGQGKSSTFDSNLSIRVSSNKPGDVIALSDKADDVIASSIKPYDVITASSKPDDVIASSSKNNDVITASSRSGDVIASSGNNDDVIMASSKDDDIVTVRSKHDDIISIEDELARQLRAVMYYNDRRFPSPGIRDVIVETTIRCEANATMCVPTPTFHIPVMVLARPEPDLTVTGTDHIARPAAVVADRSAGVLLFSDITILSRATQHDSDTAFDNMLDRCTVEERNSALVAGNFRVRAARGWLKKSGISVKVDKRRVVMRGVARVDSYQRALRNLVYWNRAAAADSDAVEFTLKCGELDGRFTSNVFRLKVTILHPGVLVQATHKQPTTTAVEDVTRALLRKPAAIGQPVAASKRDFRPIEAAVVGHVSRAEKASPLHRQSPAAISARRAEKQNSSRANMAPLLVTGTCIALLALLAIAAILHVKVRADDDDAPLADEDELVHDKEVVHVDEAHAMDWDDSAITITVNPMHDDETAADASDFSELEEEVEEEEQSKARDLPPNDRERKEHESSRAADDFYEWDA